MLKQQFEFNSFLSFLDCELFGGSHQSSEVGECVAGVDSPGHGMEEWLHASLSRSELSQSTAELSSKERG